MLEDPYIFHRNIASVKAFIIAGNASRSCQVDSNWEAPDVTDCQSRIFVDIMERVSTSDTFIIITPNTIVQLHVQQIARD